MPDGATWRLEWRGGALKSSIRDAARAAIDDTTAAAAIEAKGSHAGWQNRTGIAEGSLRGDPAKVQLGRVVGLFGSFDVAYFIWLEIGANGHPGDNTVRRAADIEFPHLAARLAARFAELNP